MKSLRPELKIRIKSLVFFCLYYSGLERLLARLIRARGTAVLMYHGVCDEAPIPDSINFHLEQRIFERQMRALKNRYPLIPLSDVVTSLAAGKPLRKGVVLTFDDGYKNNARYVTPILSRLGLPFTVFVATAYVDASRWIPLNEVYWLWSLGALTSEDTKRLRREVRGRPWHEVRAAIDALPPRDPGDSAAGEDSFAMLNWEEIELMACAGAEFGSHTHSHCNMAVESPSRQHDELALSKSILEEHLGRPVRSFAYPYGHAEHMSEASRTNVIEAGYECAVSGEYGLATSRADRFRLPRLGCDRRIWMFTGELLYQFARQTVRDLRGRS